MCMRSQGEETRKLLKGGKVMEASPWRLCMGATVKLSCYVRCPIHNTSINIKPAYITVTVPFWFDCSSEPVVTTTSGGTHGHEALSNLNAN